MEDWTPTGIEPMDYDDDDEIKCKNRNSFLGLPGISLSFQVPDMYHHESGAAKRRKTNDRKKRSESVLTKTRKLTMWLQKREIDTESLVTDDQNSRRRK